MKKGQIVRINHPAFGEYGLVTHWMPLPALPSNDVITGRGAFPRSACIAWLVCRARNKSKNK